MLCRWFLKLEGWGLVGGGHVLYFGLGTDGIWVGCTFLITYLSVGEMQVSCKFFMHMMPNVPMRVVDMNLFYHA